MDFAQYIREVEGFPKPGIQFKDITPLLLDGMVFSAAIQCMAEPFQDEDVDFVVGTEARGFIFGPPVAMSLGAGFVPARKPGKLPGEVLRQKYLLEYGEDSLEIHTGQIRPGSRVLISDDLLATGGTVQAAANLVESAGGVVVGFSFLIELSFLSGRGKLGGKTVFSLIKYDKD